MWYGKETTIIWVKTIYLLYFEYIICHLFSYLISWTNISSNTILFIIINSVMVICRGAACIFSGKYICFLFLLCQKDFARILGYLQISLFCVSLINSLFLYSRNLYTLSSSSKNTPTSIGGEWITSPKFAEMSQKWYNHR